MLNQLAPVAKAITAGLAAAIGSLLLILTGDDGFASVTTAEWLLVALNTLGAYGVTWAIPNREV